jgi:predicted NAD/FAD-binding protein
VEAERPRPKIAIVGTGISGMAAAYFLNRVADITVFEKENRRGGHANTVEVQEEGRALPVDTGFIVYNRHTYPYFCKLLEELGVETQESNMSFSVKGRRSGFEYCGTSLRTLFAQKRNLLKPWFYKMIWEILRFNKEGNRILREGTHRDYSLGRYLTERHYSRKFTEYYILPMGAAIWSTPTLKMLDFPLHSFLLFLANHGMLGVTTHFEWRTITGGSREYVQKLTASYRARILYNSGVRSVLRLEGNEEGYGRDGQNGRTEGGVRIVVEDGRTYDFDFVVMATHADTTLRLLQDSSKKERELLSLFRYQPNQAVLHSSSRVLPKNPLAWAAWNYEVDEGAPEPNPCLHYSMNRLQNLKTDRPYIVTLNPFPETSFAKVHYQTEYEHPLYNMEGMQRQWEIDVLNGTNRTYFCGAYCGYGFHEDGLRSAVAVARHFGVEF